MLRVDCDGLLKLRTSTLVSDFHKQVKSEIKTDMCHSYIVFLSHTKNCFVINVSRENDNSATNCNQFFSSSKPNLLNPTFSSDYIFNMSPHHHQYHPLSRFNRIQRSIYIFYNFYFSVSYILHHKTYI